MAVPRIRLLPWKLLQWHQTGLPIATSHFWPLLGKKKRFSRLHKVTVWFLSQCSDGRVKLAQESIYVNILAFVLYHTGLWNVSTWTLITFVRIGHLPYFLISWWLMKTLCEIPILSLLRVCWGFFCASRVTSRIIWLINPLKINNILTLNLQCNKSVCVNQSN